MPQANGERAMPAHGMSSNALARHIDREIRREYFRQFAFDIAAHLIMFSERGLRRIDVKSRAFAKIITLIIRHLVPARRGIGRNKNDLMLRTSGAVITLLCDIGMGTRQAREIGQNRKRTLTFRYENGKGHRRTRHRTFMTVHTLYPAIGLIEGEGFHHADLIIWQL